MSGYGILDYEGMNQAIYRGATSNIVVDTQKMGIGIGVDQNGPSSNLHVVGNTRLEGDINMIHTSNTSSMKVNSNVVTEFPRSKKLIKYPRVALTSAAGESSGYQGYYVTESSNSADTDRHSWKAFEGTTDNSTSDNAWANDQLTNTYNGTDNAYTGTFNLGTGAVDGEWIKLQLPNKIKLEYMKIWLKYDDSTRIPEDWKLYGSDDNTNWTELFSKTGQASINENQYSVNATSVYDYFAVVVTKISGQTDYFRIVELEYFGLPEYDPDAAGMDVKVTSYPNAPNTDWLEVYYDAKEPSSYPGTGGTVVDLSGNSRNGVLDGVTFDSASKSFVFDGVDDKIDSGPMTFTPTSSYSVSTWVKVPEVTSTQDILFQFGHGTTGEAFGMNYGRDGQISTYIFDGQNRSTPNNLYGANEWVHVTGIWYNDGTMQIYANGSRVDNSTSGNLVALSIPSNPYLTIGIHFRDERASYYTGAFFKGSIANFRLFNRALTQDEVWQLYAYQKEYFGHGDLGMTLKAGRLGIGTSEPRAVLDVRGDLFVSSPKIENLLYAPPNWGYTDNTNFETNLWSFTYTAPVDGYLILNLNAHYNYPYGNQAFYAWISVDNKNNKNSTLYDNTTVGTSVDDGGHFHEYNDTDVSWKDLNYNTNAYVSKGDHTISLRFRKFTNTYSLSINGAAIKPVIYSQKLYVI